MKIVPGKLRRSSLSNIPGPDADLVQIPARFGEFKGGWRSRPRALR
jgi:hypothetical protein